MSKLPLTHLCGYLPYRVRGQYRTGDLFELIGVDAADNEVGVRFDADPDLKIVKGFDEFKLLLRPLSDYTDINSAAFIEANIDIVSVLDLAELANKKQAYQSCRYETIEECQRNHIDYMGLIESGLAIDLNKGEAE